jgi:hypothetical protein
VFAHQAPLGRVWGVGFRAAPQCRLLPLHPTPYPLHPVLHRVKEFAKPNGETERVLQYYVDFGDNKFQWRDGDLLAVLTQAD